MAKVVIMGGGAGGVDTDQATATTNDILKGKTAAVVDIHDMELFRFSLVLDIQSQ